ncbi:MAG: hypothetical protein ACRDRE_19725 [Pseudonocardiaceae bacterium]
MRAHEMPPPVDQPVTPDGTAQGSIDAQRWIDEATTSLVTGQYVDPRAGRVIFRDYAEQWRAAQVHRPSSAAHVETMLRRHAYPAFGDRPIGTIRPSEIQAWVKGSPLARPRCTSCTA